MKTWYQCFKSQGGNLIAWNPKKSEQFNFFWFNEQGVMLAPATSSQWAYALTWGVSIQNEKLEWPTCEYAGEHPVNHQEYDEEAVWVESGDWFFRFKQEEKEIIVIAHENFSGRFVYGTIPIEKLEEFTSTLNDSTKNIFVHEDKEITGHGILTTNLYGPIFECLPSFGLISSEDEEE